MEQTDSVAKGSVEKRFDVDMQKGAGLKDKKVAMHQCRHLLHVILRNGGVICISQRSEKLGYSLFGRAPILSRKDVPVDQARRKHFTLKRGLPSQLPKVERVAASSALSPI
jgi:hypothetical protein